MFRPIHDLREVVAQQNEIIAALQARLDNSLKLMDAAKALTATLDYDELFRTIITRLVELFNLADAGLVTLYDAEAQCLKVVSCFGYNQEMALKIRLGPCEGAPGWVFYYRSPRLWSGSKECAECIDPVNQRNRELILKAISGRPYCQSMICAPFLVRGKVIGAVQLEHYRDARVFTEQDLKTLASLSDVIAIALDNMRLLNELHQKEHLTHELLGQVIAAQEEERARVARELHDSISQTLTALLVEIKGLEQELAILSATPEQIKHLDRAKKVLQQSMHDTHQLALALRPALLDELGLASAIEWYLQNHVADAGIHAKLITDGMDRVKLDYNTTTALFRVAQEALNNVARHAQAGNVQVRIVADQKELGMEIVDDGCGFSKDAVLKSPEASLGLRGMIERISLIGGSLEIDSSPGQGTRIYARVQLDRSDIA